VNNYKQDNSWKKIQKYLPKRNRLNEKLLPREYFVTIDNLKIHLDHYIPKSPKARILLFHGVGGNGRLLSFIALPLMKCGFEVVCPDLPLYGYTTYNGKITYETWVEASTELVKEFQKDSLPVFLFGLSAGGMLAYQVGCRCPKIKGIMVTCILDQRDSYITRKTAIHPIMGIVGNPFIKIAHRFWGDYQIPMKMVGNMKAITNNKQLSTLLMRDKRSSGTSVPISFLYTMLNPNIEIEPEDFQLCPFLLVHPQVDKWTDISLSKRFFNRLACKKELCILEGAGHFPVEEKGLKQLEDYCVSFINKNLE
jgi:alpha-beta hydrolase superfamily lysophospholipase